MDDPERTHSRWVWLMGLSNSTYGFAYAVVLVTIPQLLAAHGMGEPMIAGLTALATTTTLGTFIVAPILDTMTSRRTWAIMLALTVAALTVAVLLIPVSNPLFTPLFAVDALFIALYNAAMGGWLGAALPKSCDETIGTWFTIGNAGGFGIGALSQYWLMTHLPAWIGASVVGLMVLVPLGVLPLVPAHDVGRKAIHESFGNLTRDLAQLVRRGFVLRIILMFVLPCAAFTLTNAFGGLGGDFHASAALVDGANGFAATIIGLLASLAARAVLRLMPAPLMYLAVGMIGAAFTLGLIALPHIAAVYVLAVLGENIGQSFAQVAQNAIIFRSIAKDSPLAASQFGLLGTAFVVPYAYMQALDGYGYKLAGGVSGSFMMDAGLSIAACALLAVPVLHWLRAGKLYEADDQVAAVALA